MAKPRLGEPVIYTRGAGEKFAGNITRVELTRVAPFVKAMLRGPHAIIETRPAEFSTLEEDYEVWISFRAHDSDEASIEFVEGVPFDATGGTPNSWARPPAAG